MEAPIFLKTRMNPGLLVIRYIAYIMIRNIYAIFFLLHLLFQAHYRHWE